jgi:predicted dehydrogenase
VGARSPRRFAIPHVFTDHRTLLALPGLDAVSVASTPDRHRARRRPLAAGKHVLCEKPLAQPRRGAPDGERRGAARQGCVAMMDHEFRWQPERRRIKELLDRAGSARRTP